ncbi:MAG: hypothetical protein KIT84_25795 [Labilithrix sp.]|nr:hypothetical protein [Labilithrix sp.]MCW5814467.1 hypothetical protein [Labilithrix sp.]
MRQVDFNDLPRTSRERFVRSLVSVSPSAAPICRRVSKARSPVLWYLLLILTLSAMVVGVLHQFGASAAPVQDRRWLGFYVAACGLIGLALSMLGRRSALRGSLPFAPGVYVFPLDLVDARTRELELYPLSDLQSIDPVHHTKGGKYTYSTLWFAFPEKSFVFEIKGQDQAESQLAAVQSSRQILLQAMARGDLSELLAFDPFADARARNFLPTNDFGLLAKGRPGWTRFIWAITLICGLVFGVATWRLRNWQSDQRVFARLEAHPEVALAEAYVRGGGLRSPEVSSTIIPKAKLAEAKKEKGGRLVEELDKFLKAYPKSGVEAEARALFRDALHAEFLAQTTVSGVRAFIARYPDAPDAFQGQTKIRDVYAETRATFKQKQSTSDKNVVPIIESMLTWAEERPVPFDVRIRRRNVAGLAAADRLLAKGLLDDDGAPAPGGAAEVTPLFAGEGGKARDAAIVRGIERAFHAVFPADVFPLKVGASIDEATAAELPPPPKPPFPNVPSPTLVVDVDVAWSGATFLSRDTKRRYLGVQVKVDVLIQVPQDLRVLTFSLKATPPETLPVDWISGLPGSLPGAPLPPPGDDGFVYDALIVSAFEETAGPKLVSLLLAAPPASSRL